MACNVNTLLAQAASNGFFALQDRELRISVLQLLCNGGGGGGGGSAQLVTYTSGSPANPTDVTKPALAYDPTGNLPTLGWNTGTLTWN